MTREEMLADLAEIRNHIEGQRWLYAEQQLYYGNDIVWRPIEDHEVEKMLTQQASSRGWTQNDINVYLNRRNKGELIDQLKSQHFARSEDVKRRHRPELMAFLNGYVNTKTLAFQGFSLDDDAPWFFQQIPHNVRHDLLESGRAADDILFADAPHMYDYLVSLVGAERINVQLAKLGYCLYRGNPFKLMFMELGTKDTGKTTWMRVLRHIIGDGNTVQISLHDLASQQYAIADLRNKLLCWYDDLKENMVHDLGVLKVLSGDAPISSNRKYMDRIHFENYAKLMFNSNRLPKLSSMTDDAFFSRWIVTTYTGKFVRRPNVFEELVRDEQEVEALIAAALIQLKSMLDTGYEFLKDGGAQDYSEMWRKETNNVYAFMQQAIADAAVELNDSFEVPKDALYNAYLAFMEAERDDAEVTKTAFTKDLEQRWRITTARSGQGAARVQVYRGLRLNDGSAPQPQSAEAQRNLAQNANKPQQSPNAPQRTGMGVCEACGLVKNRYDHGGRSLCVDCWNAQRADAEQDVVT